MLKTINLALISAAALMGFTSAASAAATYLVQGNVPQLCTVQQAQLLSDTAPVNIANFTGNAVQIAELTDSATMATRATSFAVGFQASCNFPHRLVVESQNNGLWRTALTGEAPGFADAVPYTATILWGDTNTTFHADAAVRQISDVSVLENRPTQGEVELKFQIQPGASNANAYSPLLEGTYTDIIRVTVEPQ